MKTFSSRPCVWAPLPLALSVGLSAHASEAVVAVLSPTVVSASRVEQPLADVLPSVTVITRQDIERAQAASLADLLQGEAGFEFGRNGGPGTVTSFFLRGAESKNLVILIDGVRAPVDAWGTLTAIDLPLEAVDRIELLRGNAGALYGEAAVGGVLQIFTRSAGERDDTVAKLSAGSRGTAAAHVGLARRVGEWAVRLDAGSQTQRGFSAINPAKLPGANPDADGMRSNHVALRAEYALAPQWQWGLQVRGEDVVVDFDDAYGNPRDVNVYERVSSTVATYLKGRWSPQWTTRLDVSHYTLKTRDLLNGIPNRGDYSAGSMNGRSDSLRWFNTWSATGQTSVHFGWDVSHESYRSDALLAGFDARRQLSGVFVGLNHQEGNFSAQANVRRDTVDVEDRGGSAADQRWSQSTWLAGAGYRFAPGWRMTGTISTGFRAPSVGELSYNAALTPETYRSAEAGVTREAADGRWRAVLFQTRSNNAIDWSAWPPVNLGRTRNQGLELSADGRWWGQRWRASWVRQNPSNAETGEPLARRAKVYGSLEWLHRVGAGEGSVHLRASGPRRDFGEHLSGYATLGLTYAQPVARDWTLRLRLDNLFDRPYELAYGYNTPGRSFLATLIYQPKP